MQCNFKQDDGSLSGVMCGNSGDYCESEDWCEQPRDEKKSYWSNGTYKGDTECFSQGNRSCIKIYISESEKIY